MLRPARRLVLAALAPVALAATAAIDDARGEPAHGLSIFGDLKYPAGFAHFDYVDPDAPKGGEMRISFVGSFDNLNPFILRGEPVYLDYAIWQFDTLMARAYDEPDAMYGLVAREVEVAPDRNWAVFTLDGRARFHDGAPVTVEDVVFSFEAIKNRGHPRYRVAYANVEKAEAVAADRVKFTFAPGFNRDLPVLVAGLPVLSKAYFDAHEFDKSTLDTIVAGGPYRVVKADQGRSVTFERVPDYWARDLPTRRGQFNFDRIRIDYYRDRQIDLEAFSAYAYDFREEFTSKNWATGYDFPAVAKGWVKRAALKDETPSGAQAFFINTRRDKFKDRRVREALGYAFDYEWLNKNIFHSLYRRTESIFENTDMAARGVPGRSEMALLAPFRGQVPEELFARPIAFPKTDASGNNRANLRTATELLRQAGWAIEEGRLTNDKGERFEIEFLIFQPTFERILNPYARSLERLGIAAKIRIVDSAQYQNRLNEFDYDIVTARFVMPLTPGIEQRNLWGSATVDLSGSYNLSGVRNPVVDALIDKLIAARDRDGLTVAARALDRVLLWNHYFVPHWYKSVHHIAYWDKFSRPAVKPKYHEGYLQTWWYDDAKAAALAAKRGTAH